MSIPKALTMLRVSLILACIVGLASVQPIRAQSTDSRQTPKEATAAQPDELPLGELYAAAQPDKAAAELDASGSEATPTPQAAQPMNTFEVYGFAMLDAGYNFGTIDPDWFDVVRPTKLNAFPDQFAPDGQVYFSARQTRFGVRSTVPTALGDLKTIFEFELFGVGVDAGQTTFRLRHAYGELGHFGAGQTWSPFMDIDVFPNSVEYWGPTGMVFFRNLQVRYMPIQGDSRVTIALERPGASGDGGIYADRIELQNIRGHFKWPDLSGEARLAKGWGYVELAGIIRSIAWEDQGGNPTNLSGSGVGWGVSVSSNVKITPKDTGRFQVVYGRGVENYMNDATIDVGPKTNPGNTITPLTGSLLPVLGIVSFVDHNWTNKFSTAIGYSMVNIENSDAQNPSDFNQGHYALGNLLYKPVPQVTVGGEYQFGRRVNFSDGFNVNDSRIQFSFKFDFAKKFEF